VISVYKAIRYFSILTLGLVHSAADAKLSLYEMDLRALLNVKVKSVSKIEEPLTDSIIPVTLITQTMIRGSGARTLRDLLTTFVPGMTFVQDQNEVNVAMRGVFSSAQQKILILLEGHRLNSRLISAANPDHAIGLDKIKQIEVTRGPGSSVYGNVALTAVVNIVLIKANELDGIEVAVAAGNYGQKKLSINWGQTIAQDSEIFGWFYGYENVGEKVSISPENDYAIAPASEPVNSIIGGFFDKPALDIGVKFDYKNWSLMLNQRRAHYVEPFTSTGLTGEAFNYNDYQQLNGIGPGFQYTFSHLSLTHKTQVNPELMLENRLYFDKSDMESTFVINPSIQLFGQGQMYDKAIGLTSQLAWSKKWGSAVVGMQYDQVDVYDSGFPFGSGGVLTGDLYDDENPLVRPGKENVQSYYVIVKNYLSEQWLSNFGFRHDIKDRLTLEDQENTSPRLGLVYFADNDFQIKMSYSESFVDSPYWNRYGALPSFRGSENLAPEKLKSIQLTPSWQLLDGRLSYELNLFFNDLTDAVFRNNAAAADQPINTNAGKIESRGHEHQLIYRDKSWQLRLVAFFNKVTDFEDFAADEEYFYNIPNQTLNLIYDHQWSDTFHSSLALNYTGKQLSPINISLNGVPVVDTYPDSGVEFQQPNNWQSARTIANLNLTWQDLVAENTTIELNFYNLFDKNYLQGGTTLHPYQQEGRWIQAQVRFQF